MNEIQPLKQRTVLVKRTGEKIIVDIPFETVDQAMSHNTLKISGGHSIRASAINEWYALNVTNELDLWIEETYPLLQEKIMEIVKKRRKDGIRVNRDVVNNIVESFSKNCNETN